MGNVGGCSSAEGLRLMLWGDAESGKAALLSNWEAKFEVGMSTSHTLLSPTVPLFHFREIPY